MRLSYKFALQPNRQQVSTLSAALETLRWVYNTALGERISEYERTQKSMSPGEQQKIFQGRRNREPAGCGLASVSAVAMRDTLARLNKAYEAFFRRVKKGEKPGFPKFQKRDEFNSIPDEQNDTKLIGPMGKPIQGFMSESSELKGYKLRFPKCYGIKPLRIRLHRPVKGKIKTVTVKREGNKWFVIFSCDLGDTPTVNVNRPPIGIDVGIENFLTDSDGNIIPNPEYLDKELAAIRRAAKKIALRHGKKKPTRMYCLKNSNRRNAGREKLRKLHGKIANRRKDLHHKVALALVNRYGLIAVEKLNVKGMLEDRKLSRRIADVGWRQFLNILKYKAENAGVKFIEVDPAYTSQECSGCGAVVPKTLDVRVHECPDCGLKLHRDHNAARVILSRALRHGVGQTQRVRSPVDSTGWPENRCLSQTAVATRAVASEGGQKVA